MSARAAQPHPYEVQDRELSLCQTATPGLEGGGSDPVASGEHLLFGSKRLLPTAAAPRYPRPEKPASHSSPGRWKSGFRHTSNISLLDKIRADYIRAVPTIDLPADELAAVAAAIRRIIEDDKFPHAPRLDSLRAALARLDAATRLERVEAVDSLRKSQPKAPPPAKADKRARR